MEETVDHDGLYAEGTLALILRLCLCAGVAPLRASRAGAGWRFHVSAPRAALQTVVMTTINIMLVTGIYLELHLPPDERIHDGETVVQTPVWVADFVLSHVIVSLAIYRGRTQMESLKLVLGQLQQVKFDLNVRRPSAKTVRVKNIAMVVALIWMGSIVMTDAVMYESEAVSNGGAMWKINLCVGVIHIVDVMGKLAVMKWACTVLAVHEGATALNRHLKRLRHGSVFSRLRSDESVKATEALIRRRLSLSHVRMSAVIRQINDTHGLFLMVLLMFIFLQIIIIPYYMLFQEIVYGMALSINWLIIYLTLLTLIIEPCHWTHTQREHTVFLLRQLIVHQGPRCERLSRELEQFAKQLTLSNTKFCALGVYTLDRELTAAMLGGVITYLVIVIQFQNASDIN